jgi:hypothetical protein
VESAIPISKSKTGLRVGVPMAGIKGGDGVGTDHPAAVLFFSNEPRIP